MSLAAGAQIFPKWNLDSIPKDDKTYWKKALLKGKLNFKDTAVVYPKFVKFCVNVYNWADRTFNTYDTAYVQGTGKKFKVLIKNENWLDSYAMRFSNGTYMTMASIPASTIGAYLSFSGLSAGYSYSIGKIFNYKEGACQNLRFQFNCALLAAEWYYSHNDGGTKIRNFTQEGVEFRNIDLPGLTLNSYGIDVYYFLNNKKYSQGAAYNFSKIQKKSAGSFIFGASISHQSVEIDLTKVPPEIAKYLPEGATEYNYHYNDYCLIVGYGYNWVFHKNWLFNISAMPSFGIKHCNETSLEGACNLFSMNVNGKLSITRNLNHVFYGLQGRISGHWYKSEAQSFFNSIAFLTLNFGFRF